MQRRDIAAGFIASVTASVLTDKAASGATKAAQFFPQTAAEVAAGITPTDCCFPELNILRYGAPINAGDAAPALKACVAVLAQLRQGELLIPAGYSFNLTQVVFSSLSNFNVRCDGVIVSVAEQYGTAFTDQRNQLQGAHSAFKFISCTHFKLTGSGYIQPGYAEPMYIKGCHDFEISIDCRGIGLNSTLSGIYIQNCYQFVLRDMVVDSITAQKMTDSIEVYHSWLNNVQILDCNDFRISGWRTRKSGMNGVYVGSNCYDFDINNNIFEYNAGSGIQITWAGYGDMPARYKVNNNVFRFNQADGLDNANTSKKGTVHVFAQFNNNLHVCNGWKNCNPANSAGSDGSGLGTFYRIASFEAIGNMVFECATWGIFCVECDDFTLSANTVQKSQMGTLNGGIYISALNRARLIANDICVPPDASAFTMHSCSDVIVDGCAFVGLIDIADGDYPGCKLSRSRFNCGTEVVAQFDVSDCNIEVSDPHQNGLYVPRHGISLYGNTVTAPGNAVVVSSANFCKLINNVATSTGKGAGIYVTGAVGTSIRGNKGDAISGPGLCVTGSSTQTELAMNQAASVTGNSFLIDESSTRTIKYGNVIITGVPKFAGSYDVNF